MKVAGLTWWRNNYGSILQAYALQTFVSELDGVSYEIINQYGKKITSADNLIDKLKTVGVRKTLKRFVWRFGLKKLRLRVRNMQLFIDRNLKISDRVYNEASISEANRAYDAFLCGSDQIWNPALVSPYSMYWLWFVGANKKKIAYAPSIGVNHVSAEDGKIIFKNLSDFTSISCREESGSNLINTIMNGQVCETVVDPTMLVERSVWDQICTPRIYDHKYVFVYMLRGTKKQRKIIEAYAKHKKLSIITIPFLDHERIELYDFKFGDFKCWDASPADFISLIRYAELIFTDSFHSMVFSCLYHRPFFSFPKIGKAQINRMTDLQRMLGIQSRMIEETTSLEYLDNCQAIDWVRVDTRLEERRQLSVQYLKKAIEE